MTRSRQSALLAGAFLLALAVSPARAGALAPQEGLVTVEGEHVTLGDLFDLSNAPPEAAGLAVAAAPPPGGRIVLDLARVRAFAEARGVALPASPALASVTVTRASRLVSAEEIEQLLAAAIAKRGMSGVFRIRFSGPEPALHVPANAETSALVESLDLDPVTGQFRARIRALGADMRTAPVTVAGRAYAVSQVPVPAHAIAMGEVIAPEDLTWSEIPSERLAQNVITGTDALVGFAPRRELRAGAPILSGDVKKPVVVTKGSIVAMVVRARGMTLTAQGRALEDGAHGESVRVLNTQTKRTIEARVVNPGEVLVETAAARLAALP